MSTGPTTCMICGGPMIKQHVLNNCHRHKDDCIGYLKLALKQSQALYEAAAFFGREAD
jgi:hypothetical protein